MSIIDKNITAVDCAICRYLDNIGNSSRGVVSQDILARLVHLVEQIMLKFYANGKDIDDSEENINAAIEYVQINGELKILYRFRNYLQIVAIHCTLDENASERLMLKYYQYLLETKMLVEKYFNMQILQNLNKFPLNLDSALQEYYAKIADKIEQHPAHFSDKGNKYYIQKRKPFFVGNRIFNMSVKQQMGTQLFVFMFSKQKILTRKMTASLQELLYRFSLHTLFQSTKHRVWSTIPLKLLLQTR